MATMEQQVEEEQREHDEGNESPEALAVSHAAVAAADAEGEETELFDKTQYETEELALPKVDGEGVDKLRAKFNGTVWLERGSEHDVALIRDVKLGQTVTLLVEAKVGPPVPGWTTSLEGDLDTISLGRTFTVESVRRAAGEDL